VTLAWDPPTQSVDGSSLSDLAGFNLYGGIEPGRYELLLNAGLSTEATIDSLAPGTYEFVVTAVDRAGNESVFSTAAVATVP
jgi:hypothetical protein